MGACMKKRIVSFILSILVIFFTLFNSYDNVKAFDIPTAFWGTMEASRAYWTAMNTGGALKNGINFEAIERSSREDMQKLQTQILIAYTAFCIYKEKIALKLSHPDWTEDQVNEEAISLGNKDSEDFKKSAINVDNTTNGLTLKDWKYWKEFCDQISYIAQNGLGSGQIGANTSVNGKIFDFNLRLIDNLYNSSNVGGNTFVYNDYYYINKGVVPSYDPNNGWSTTTYEFTDVPTDRVRIGFMEFSLYWSGQLDINYKFIDINRLTGEYITNGSWQGITNRVIYNFSGNYYEVVQGIINNCQFPCAVADTNYYRPSLKYQNIAYESLLSVSQGSSTEEYQTMIEDALGDSEAGKSIKEGGRAKTEIILPDSIPVKRSGIKVGEEEAEGVIGWDIPDARVIEGAIADPNTEEEEIKATGVISVPESKVIGATDETTVVAWDKDEPISVPTDDTESISVPITDVISIQGGDYYPEQFSLDELFPFCIPFDIYHCIQKFNVSSGEAPIIHLPIIYPNALKGVLGDYYDVVIDFNQFITLRNIIRGFILIFFIVGLMMITRNLIRG